MRDVTRDEGALLAVLLGATLLCAVSGGAWIASWSIGYAAVLAVLVSPTRRRQRTFLAAAGQVVAGHCVLLGVMVALGAAPALAGNVLGLAAALACLHFALRSQADASSMDALVAGLDLTRVPLLSDELPVFHREVRRARRQEAPLSILSLVPEFSEQDALPGSPLESLLHERIALARIANFIAPRVKEFDLVARGDQSVLLVLPNSGPEAARSASERIRASVEDLLRQRVRVNSISLEEPHLGLSAMLEKLEGDVALPR